MLLVGGLIYGLHEQFGHYFVEGVGYSTIQAILNGSSATVRSHYDDLVRGRRLWRKNGVMALVVRGGNPRFRIPRAADIIAVITKEHIADAVAASIQAFPR